MPCFNVFIIKRVNSGEMEEFDIMSMITRVTCNLQYLFGRSQPHGLKRDINMSIKLHPNCNWRHYWGL